MQERRMMIGKRMPIDGRMENLRSAEGETLVGERKSLGRRVKDDRVVERELPIGKKKAIGFHRRPFRFEIVRMSLSMD